MPLRAPLRKKLNRNVATMNRIVNAAVAQYGLVLIDLAGRPDMFTSAVRAVDRLHSNRYGHQLIAAAVVKELHVPCVGHWVQQEAPAEVNAALQAFVEPLV